MQDGDVVGALATLKQGMHESTIHKGNNDMFAVFAILKSQQCLALHDHVSAGDVLDKVESLQEVNSNESGGNGSSSSAGIQCKEIRLLAQILRLVLLSHIGNHTYAMVLIKQIQAGIEAIVALESEQQQQQQQPISSSSSTSTLAPSSSEYTIKSSCYISVPVTATSSPSSSSSNTATTTSTSLRIQLLSTQQFIALICLLTGIVYKPVETTKAKRYLTQGLKSVNRQLFHSNYSKLGF